MAKAIKVFLIVVVLDLTLGSGIVLARELYRAFSLYDGLYSLDYSHLILLAFLIISMLSLLFQLATFNVAKQIGHLTEDPIDSVHFEKPQYRPGGKLVRLLGVINFLLAVVLIVSGVGIFILIQDSFPIRELPRGIWRYVLALFLFLSGVLLIVDQNRLNARYRSVHKRIY